MEVQVEKPSAPCAPYWHALHLEPWWSPWVQASSSSSRRRITPHQTANCTHAKKWQRIFFDIGCSKWSQLEEGNGPPRELSTCLNPGVAWTVESLASSSPSSPQASRRGGERALPSTTPGSSDSSSQNGIRSTSRCGSSWVRIACGAPSWGANLGASPSHEINKCGLSGRGNLLPWTLQGAFVQGKRSGWRGNIAAVALQQQQQRHNSDSGHYSTCSTTV
eukprot:1150359-Pelagomonas_calceolata.AAC.6